MSNDIPPTAAVRAVMADEHGSVTDDELRRILAHCLVRDEMERMKLATVNAQVVADLSAPVHLWITRGAFRVRTANVLYNADLRCMADVWAFRDSDLLRLKNLGRMCLNEIKALRFAIGTVTEADLSAALAKRPTRDEAHLAMINRGVVPHV